MSRTGRQRRLLLLLLVVVCAALLFILTRMHQLSQQRATPASTAVEVRNAVQHMRIERTVQHVPSLTPRLSFQRSALRAVLGAAIEETSLIARGSPRVFYSFRCTFASKKDNDRCVAAFKGVEARSVGFYEAAAKNGFAVPPVVAEPSGFLHWYEGRDRLTEHAERMKQTAQEKLVRQLVHPRKNEQ